MPGVNINIEDLTCYRELKNTGRFLKSLGSLGGGNHFIEIGVDKNENKYLVIHTGSRNLGAQAADYHQNLAYDLLRGKGDYFEKREELIADYKAQGRRKEIQDALKALLKEYEAKDCGIRSG